MTPRLIVSMLAYNEYDMAIGALEAYRYSKTLEAEQYLFDPGYPGTSPEEWQRIAEQFGFQYVQIINRGVSGNINQMILVTMAGPEDILFCLDPDEYIGRKSRHWMFSIIQAFHKQPDAAYIGFNRPKLDLQHPSKQLVDLGDVHLFKYDGLVDWKLGAFHGRFFSKYPIEQSCPQYGKLEQVCWERMKYIDQSYYVLKDFYAYHKESNYKYSTWKKDSVNLDTSLPFDVWVKTFKKK